MFLQKLVTYFHNKQDCHISILEVQRPMHAYVYTWAAAPVNSYSRLQ